MIGVFDYCLCGNQGLLTFHKWLALQAKTEQIRHETQGIARLLPSFITQTEKVLATAFQDKHIFCCYCVMCQSFKMTKFPVPCLIAAKKYALPQTQTNCQQTLIFALNILQNIHQNNVKNQVQKRLKQKRLFISFVQSITNGKNQNFHFLTLLGGLIKLLDL